MWRNRIIPPLDCAGSLFHTSTDRLASPTKQAPWTLDTAWWSECMSGFSEGWFERICYPVDAEITWMLHIQLIVNRSKMWLNKSYQIILFFLTNKQWIDCLQQSDSSKAEGFVAGASAEECCVATCAAYNCTGDWCLGGRSQKPELLAMQLVVFQSVFFFHGPSH